LQYLEGGNGAQGLGKIFHYAIVLIFLIIHIVGGPSKYPFGVQMVGSKVIFYSIRGPMGGEVGGGPFDEGFASVES
jgi:hypothetical protein